MWKKDTSFSGSSGSRRLGRLRMVRLSLKGQSLEVRLPQQRPCLPS